MPQSPKKLSKTHTNQFLLATKLHQKGELKEAINLYQKILITAPNFQVCLNLAAALIDLRQSNEAIEYIDQAIKIDPKNPESYFLYGNALLQLSLLDAAIAGFDIAIKINPSYVSAHHNKALALESQGKFPLAIESYQMAAQLNDLDPEVHQNCGLAFCKLGKYAEAISYFCKSLDITKENKIYWSNFSVCLGKINNPNLLKDLSPYILDLINKKTSAIRPSIISKIAIHALEESELIQKFIQITSQVPTEKDILDIVRGLSTLPLFKKLLTLAPIADLRYEKSLRTLRRIFLKSDSVFVQDPNVLEFSTLLAQQCFINEFVYFELPEEGHLIEQLEAEISLAVEDGDIPPHKIATLATYRPLHSYPWSLKLAKTPSPNILTDMIRVQVLECHEELTIRNTIRPLTSVNNPTSKLVQLQYEENPYPRWISAHGYAEQIRIRDLFSQMHLVPEFANLPYSKSPNILIAGCGTGQHAILSATRFLNAKVTAIDLSLSSLCYATRKTRELGLKNITYFQGDLLELDALEDQFDIVESVGVLHHLLNPEEGLRNLVRRLKTGGLIHLGLYSEIARKDISLTRKLIKDKNLSNSQSDIQILRNSIINNSHLEFNKLQSVMIHNDFFSTSECRDLLFHVQEHCFNLIQVENLLKVCGLTFLGFEFLDESFKEPYRAQMLDNTEYLLTHWHEFELQNTSFFSGMYQFWAIKV
ncbi:MAG: methyltransferase domain-containing protein [Chitinophagia bacterium]|nr:methyltransferase domain-containing protein [Chitinophagia bacterium]